MELEKRADGKRRTGDLLGGLWDDVAIARSMTGCPYCKTKVKHEATKCSNCQEWLFAKETAQNAVNAPGNTNAATESVKGNLAKLGPLEIAIVAIVAMIGIGLLSRILE